MSVIYRTGSGTTKEVIYSNLRAARPSQVWQKMLNVANGYKYAEHGLTPAGSFDGKFANWPSSEYDKLGNNSNSFIRYVVLNSGFSSFPEISSHSHPGNYLPQPVTDWDRKPYLLPFNPAGPRPLPAGPLPTPPIHHNLPGESDFGFLGD